MKMRSYTTKILAVVGFVLSVGAFAASAETVYDNTTTPCPVIHGFGSEEGGDQVTLAGTERLITELEIGFIAVAGTADLRVRMYANDAPEGKPGTLLYDSFDLYDVPVVDGLNTLTVYPDVTVPDTFTWTLQRVDGIALQMSRYGPPTIGSSGDFFWQNSQGVFWWWREFSGLEDSFYARMEAGYDPVELLNDLVQTVIDLNLHNGIENSLDAKLDTALQALDDINANNDVAAVNVLEAFINAVEAQRDNKIPEADADSLIADTQQIITLLTEG